MKKKYKNICVEIMYDEINKLVVQKWNGEYYEDEQFKDALKKTVEVFNTYGAQKLLSDTREQSIVGGANYAPVIVPELVNSGMKKMAFLISDDILSKLGVFSFITAANSPRFIKFFRKQKDATNWLFDKE